MEKKPIVKIRPRAASLDQIGSSHSEDELTRPLGPKMALNLHKLSHLSLSHDSIKGVNHTENKNVEEKKVASAQKLNDAHMELKKRLSLVKNNETALTPDSVSREEKNFFIAQLQKKDDQIGKLTESVSCMTQEIQKLNSLIQKLQDQIAKSQVNNSVTSKGMQNVPFSKVLQPEGKKNGSLSEKTPLAKVPSVPAKKTVKFSDAVKRDAPKAHTNETEEIVKEIQASCWKGNDLSYLILLESGVEKWIKAADCTTIQGMVNEFHKQNPGAPNKDDYSLLDSLKSDHKRKRTIMSTIKKNQASKLKSDDIGFLARSIVQESSKPKEFAKAAFSIANKRVFKGFTYAQKQTTMKKIIHQYGLSQKVVRISLVGDSILELFTIKEENDLVIARMKSNGWSQVNFNPEELPGFISERDENAQKNALINRVAFLYAGTTLINLRKILLQDISESTSILILARAEEIMNKRTAIKEGRAQAKLVQKSEL